VAATPQSVVVSFDVVLDRARAASEPDCDGVDRPSVGSESPKGLSARQDDQALASLAQQRLRPESVFPGYMADYRVE
jgi:hypothetical protein